jgi:hypothetical protein
MFRFSCYKIRTHRTCYWCTQVKTEVANHLYLATVAVQEDPYYNWVVTQWQWLFYMYTKYEIGYY